MSRRVETSALVAILVWATGLLVALLAIPVFLGWAAEGWAALAQWVTAGIAGAAAVFALNQVREARRTREQQAEPHVVAYTVIKPDVWQ